MAALLEQFDSSLRTILPRDGSSAERPFRPLAVAETLDFERHYVIFITFSE